jgi:mitochondrial FAD-linked sulfhydryl oxidase
MPSSLDRIFSSAAGSTAGPSSTPSSSSSSSSEPYDTTSDPVVKELANGYKRLASGVVLDASGKPCRQCTANSAWMNMMKRTSDKSSSSSSSTSTTSTLTSSAAAGGSLLTTSSTSTTSDAPTDCPPDVEALGRSTWTLLHTLAASYPRTPSPSMQATTRAFISTFSQLYPCGYCAEDFRAWLKEPGNEVQTQSQDAFGDWACRAHNAVNVKLGKEEFDCKLWKERWRDGWADGRCG